MITMYQKLDHVPEIGGMPKTARSFELRIRMCNGSGSTLAQTAVLGRQALCHWQERAVRSQRRHVVLLSSKLGYPAVR